jgi:hypothetical protein
MSLVNVYMKQIAVVWDVAPSNMVGTDRRFRGAYCLHYEGD